MREAIVEWDRGRGRETGVLTTKPSPTSDDGIPVIVPDSREGVLTAADLANITIRWTKGRPSDELVNAAVEAGFKLADG